MEPLRSSRRHFVAGAAAWMATGRSRAAASSPYLDVVRRCLQARMESGRDTLGPRKTSLFLSVLDRRTVRPLAALPEAPAGVRPSDRTGVHGSNPNLQQNLFLTLREFSRITGERSYSDAADAALLEMIRLTQHPYTGLLAWGEHLYWDCLLERAESQQSGKLIHEPKHKLLFFDFLYEAEPQRTLAYAKGIWDHQIADQTTGDFSRHARYDAHDPGKGADFLKEGGYFVDLWSRAYEKSQDPVYLKAIHVLTDRYLGRMTDQNLLDFDSSPDPERDNNCLTNDMLAFAVEAHPAAARVDAATKKKLLHIVERLDDGFLRLPHVPDDEKQGFYYSLYTDSGKLRPRKGDDGHSRHWALGYGVKSTSLFGVFCHTRLRQLGTGPRADRYRDLCVRAARLYGRLDPPADSQDIWAGEFGMAIFLELAAYRLSKDRAFLDHARSLADRTMAVLWDGGTVLPRASSKTAHMEDISYADTVLLSFLALHEHVAGLPPRVEISDLDR